MAVLGQGTQRLETTLSLAMNPFSVTRIDRDSAGAGGAGKLLALAQDGFTSGLNRNPDAGQRARLTQLNLCSGRGFRRATVFWGFPRH